MHDRWSCYNILLDAHATLLTRDHAHSITDNSHSASTTYSAIPGVRCHGSIAKYSPGGDAINTQLTPILQWITETLSSLQMDNQNIKKTLNVQQNQIRDIRNIAKTQNHPSGIPQRPDALKQNTSRRMSKNNIHSNINLAEFQLQRS